MFSILLGLALVLTRISGFFLVLPVFGWQAIPPQIKAAVAIVLSLFFCTCKPLAINPAEISAPMAIVLLAGEALYGLALGLIVALLFSVVQLSGRIAEQQMGMTMAEIVDPLKGEETGELSSLHGDDLPPAVPQRQRPPPVPADPLEELRCVPAGHDAHARSARRGRDRDQFGHVHRQPAAGGPAACGAFLVLMVALALLARLVPEMDILTVSMPVRVALGLFLVMAFLPFVAGFVTEMADWMAKLLPI